MAGKDDKMAENGAEGANPSNPDSMTLRSGRRVTLEDLQSSLDSTRDRSRSPSASRTDEHGYQVPRNLNPETGSTTSTLVEDDPEVVGQQLNQMTEEQLRAFEEVQQGLAMARQQAIRMMRDLRRLRDQGPIPMTQALGNEEEDQLLKEFAAWSISPEGPSTGTPEAAESTPRPRASANRDVLDWSVRPLPPTPGRDFSINMLDEAPNPGNAREGFTGTTNVQRQGTGPEPIMNQQAMSLINKLIDENRALARDVVNVATNNPMPRPQEDRASIRIWEKEVERIPKLSGDFESNVSPLVFFRAIEKIEKDPERRIKVIGLRTEKSARELFERIRQDYPNATYEEYKNQLIHLLIPNVSPSAALKNCRTFHETQGSNHLRTP